MHRGKPVLKIPKEIINLMSRPFNLMLIGKFSHNRPTMEKARQKFKLFDLKGSIQLGQFDGRHMLIQLTHEGDFQRTYLKKTWYISGFPMWIFKWTSSFRLEIES